MWHHHFLYVTSSSVKTPLSSQVGNLVLISVFNVFSIVLSMVLFLTASCCFPVEKKTRSIMPAAQLPQVDKFQDHFFTRPGCMIRQSLRLWNRWVRDLSWTSTELYSFEQATWLTNLMSQLDFFSSVKAGATHERENECSHWVCCRSQPVLPVGMLHCCQSICEFFVISSSSDVVILEVGRHSVLISGDKSASRHCANFCGSPLKSRNHFTNLQEGHSLPLFPRQPAVAQDISLQD